MFHKIKTIGLMFIALISFNTTFATQHQSGNIMINDPWVRSAPPNAPALGAFMQIANHSDTDVKLLSANVAGYKRVELHRTIPKNGVMQMVKQEFMPIPAHGELMLKPGSWHIMLIGPESVPSKGESVKIELIFDNGLSKTVHAKVRKGKMMHHKKMMHHH